MSHFFPLKLHPSPPDSFQPGPQHPAEGPRRLPSPEGSLSRGPQHQRSWGLGNTSKVLEDRGPGPHRSGALGLWSQSGELHRRRLRGVSIKRSLLGCLDSTPSQRWGPSQLRLRDGTEAQVRKVGGNNQGNAFIFFNFMPVLCQSILILWLSVCRQCTAA